jgi:hypothetical protein
MRNRASLKVVLLGLLTFALVPGIAVAANQGQDLSEMLASNAAVHATAVSGPVIMVTPLALNSGIVDKNTTVSLPIQVCNTGDAFLNVFDVTFSDPAYSFPVAAGGLAPGACTGGLIVVSFSPLDGLAHPATMTITSDASNGTQVVPLNGQGNSAPVLGAIGNKSVSAFSTLAFTLTANDLDDTVDDVLIFSMGAGLPPTATFDTGSGEFSWTPSAAEAGTYSVEFSVSDGRLSDSETISIMVNVTNQPPVANAGGTYFGATGRPVQFNGTGSSDPDGGQTLSYAWTFGDGGTANGVSPQHTYLIEGNFLASLTVCDNGSPQLCASDVAAVTIQTEIAADIILKNNGTTLDTRWLIFWTQLGIEEVLVPYTDIDVASLRLSSDYPNSGTVANCPADTRFVKFGDMDADGVTDFDNYFSNWCLFKLFFKTPDRTVVNLTITGNFVQGTSTIPLRATKSGVMVRTWKGVLYPVRSLASPNPFNPETSISYAVAGNGPVTMRIYGVSGRLVRTLKSGEYTNAGTHAVRWNGTDDQGRHVPSGIYFVKTSQKTSAGEEASVLKVALTK